MHFLKVNVDDVIIYHIASKLIYFDLQSIYFKPELGNVFCFWKNYSAVGSHSRRRILEMGDSCYVSRIDGLRRMGEILGRFMQCKLICAPLDSSRRELSIGTKIVENGVMGTKL